MTESDVQKLKKMWNAFSPLQEIYHTLPYKIREIREKIDYLMANGEIADRRGQRLHSTREKVLNAFIEDGLSMQEIADRFNLKFGTVKAYLYAQGTGLRKEGRAKKTPPTDKTLQILAEIEKGQIPISEIADRFDVSRQRVYFIRSKKSAYRFPTD